MDSVLLALAVCAVLIVVPDLDESPAARQQPDLRFDCASTFPANLSARELADRYGEENVHPDTISLGEGFYTIGTVLFPTAPTRRAEIVWKDSVNMRSPAFVRIGRGATEWVAPPGVAISTTLKALEALNRRPFRMAGFAFDGSGVVASWSNGRLESATEAPCRLRARVDFIDFTRAAVAKHYRQVVGDRVFSSGHPALQHLNPSVSELWLDYLLTSP